MAITWKTFDEAYARSFQKLWQACFLFTGSVQAADDHCFRAFLVLGASDYANKAETEQAADEILLHAAAELARRYYSKKPRRRLTRRYLDRYPLAVPVSDEVLQFLHKPLNTRITSVAAAWGLTGESLQRTTGMKLLSPKPVLVPDLTDIEPNPELQERMSSQIYMRFAERNVAVENKIHRAGRRFERIAPYLALLVLALFAFAYFYTERLR